MGLSPFRGAMSRFLVLYDLMGHGHWLLAAAGTAANLGVGALPAPRAEFRR